MLNNEITQIREKLFQYEVRYIVEYGRNMQ